MVRCRWYALLMVATVVLCCACPVGARLVSVKDLSAVGKGSADDM